MKFSSLGCDGASSVRHSRHDLFEAQRHHQATASYGDQEMVTREQPKEFDVKVRTGGAPRLSFVDEKA